MDEVKDEVANICSTCQEQTYFLEATKYFFRFRFLQNVQYGVGGTWAVSAEVVWNHTSYTVTNNGVIKNLCT
jgi:hypothetical protein